MFKSNVTLRRLWPLYAAAFLQGIPFWYAIEKLFMVSIGFNTASIGLMVAIMSCVMLMVETPSGVLADRWSRKGVMILGCGSLLISAVVGALSFNEPIYILSTVFWGIYAALYSGTYDAVIYDTVIEDHGNSKKFEYYLGRFRMVEGISFVIGALAGGYIASTLSMREAYVLSIPFLLVAFIFLYKYKEPQLHKAEVSDPVFLHIRQTFGAVLKNPVLLPVVIATVGFGILQDSIFELSQLWYIAVAAPVVLYGIFSAALFSSWTTGGILAARIKSNVPSLTLMGTSLTASLCLIFSRSYGVIVVAQSVFALCLIALGVILARKMHDELPSKLRAGSASVVSTLARTILIPGSLLFTWVANTYSIFSASYILLAIAGVSTIAFLFIVPTRNTILGDKA